MVRLVVVVVVVVGFIHEPTTFLPSPSSPSLYTLDQYFTYIRVLRKKKDYLLLVLWGGVLFDLLLLLRLRLLHLLVMVVAVAVVVVGVVRATLHTQVTHHPYIIG